MTSVLLQETIIAEKPPQLDHLYPAGGAIGSSTEVELIGSFERWPPRIWTSSEDIGFTLQDEKGKVVFDIKEDAPPGPRLIRCYDENGASNPKFFIVSESAEIVESERNDQLIDAIPILEFPTVVNGRLQSRGDVDSFQIPLRKGQWLVAEAVAYRMQSTMDPLLQVVDEQGNKRAFNHDHHRLDPFLTFRAPEAGFFTVQIMGFEYPAKADIRLGGGKNYVYRLHLDNGPYLQTAMPPVHRRNTQMVHHLRGWNLPESETTALRPSTNGASSNTATFKLESTTRRFQIPLTELNQTLETDHPSDEPQQISVPGAVTGQIVSDGEEDQYRIKLQSDTRYTLKLKTQAPIHQFDAWLELRDLEGKQLQRNDDGRTDSDPAITFTPKETAEYDVFVGNLFDYGSDNYIYHLSIEHALPRFEASVSSSQLVLTRGSTNTVSISIARLHGHDDDIQIRFRNLPTSVHQSGGLAAEKKSSCELQLIPREDAPPFLGEVFLWATDSGNNQQYPVPVKLVGTSVNNGVPAGFKELVIEETPSFWLTIPPLKKSKDTIVQNP